MYTEHFVDMKNNLWWRWWLVIFWWTESELQVSETKTLQSKHRKKSRHVMFFSENNVMFRRHRHCWSLTSYGRQEVITERGDLPLHRLWKLPRPLEDTSHVVVTRDSGLRAHESDLSRSACSGLAVETLSDARAAPECWCSSARTSSWAETKMAVAESDRDRVGDREVSLPPS